MKRQSHPDAVLVGLDAGTTKICTVVGEVVGGMLIFRGMRTSPSAGMRKGVVISIEEMSLSIRNALKETETSFGVEINSVYASVSGAHVKGFRNAGVAGIGGREIRWSDIDQALDSARDICVPIDREILHLMPAGYSVDGQNGIPDPIGMTGERLEAKIYAITGASAPMQNFLKCCANAGVEVADTVFAPVAAAGSVLTEDERERGVVLVDIGGGTTDILVYKDGCPAHAAVLAIGGNHFTNDIAVGLRVSVNHAELIKRSSEAAAPHIAGDAEYVEVVHGGQKKTVPRRLVAEILQARTDEFLDLTGREFRSCRGYDAGPGGVVLTGGGALLKGLEEMAEAAWGLPVRLGSPVNANGVPEIEDNPGCSTGAGLVLYGFAGLPDKLSASDAVAGIFGRMKDWARGIFKIKKGGMEYVRN